MIWLSRWLIALLLVLLPQTVYWPVGTPVAQGVLKMYVTPGLYLSDFAVGLVLIIGLVYKDRFLLLIKRADHSHFKLTFPFIFLVGLAWVTSPVAISPGLAQYTALRWLLALGLYLVLLALGGSIEPLAKILVISLGVQSLVGLAQVIHQGPLGLPGELALSIDQYRAAVIKFDGVVWLRAYGLAFHPNVLGGFLCVGLLLGLPLLQKWYMRLVWWLLALGLLLTFSRSAWLSIAITLPLLVIWLFWRFPTLRRSLVMTLAPAGIIVLVAAIFLANQIMARFKPMESFVEFTSLAARGQMIEIAFEAIRDEPLAGIGAGNFPLAMLNYELLDPPHYVHNVGLLLAAEVGILGGLLWLWLWFAPIVTSQKVWQAGDPCPVVLIAAWFAWGAIGLWDFYPWALESGRLFSVILLVWIASTLFKSKLEDERIQSI